MGAECQRWLLTHAKCCGILLPSYFLPPPIIKGVVLQQSRDEDLDPMMHPPLIRRLMRGQGQQQLPTTATGSANHISLSMARRVLDYAFNRSNLSGVWRMERLKKVSRRKEVDGFPHTV